MLYLRSTDRFNWYGFNHEKVRAHFEGDLAYVGTFCVLDEEKPVAVYKNAKPNREKNHKDYLLLSVQDNLFEDAGGKIITLIRGMDKREMGKWRYQQGVMCQQCDDIIYSVMRHDWRHCMCGDISVDGGRAYLKIGYTDLPAKTVTIDLLTGKVRE